MRYEDLIEESKTKVAERQPLHHVYCILLKVEKNKDAFYFEYPAILCTLDAEWSDEFWKVNIFIEDHPIYVVYICDLRPLFSKGCVSTGWISNMNYCIELLRPLEDSLYQYQLRYHAHNKVPKWV